MQILNRTSVSVALFAFLAAVPIACGGGDKPATNPTMGTASASSSTPGPMMSAPVASASATPAPAASATPPNPLASILTVDPAQVAALLAAAANAIPGIVTPPVAGDPIEAGIKAAAAKQAPGMQPVGGITRGDVKEGGDHVSMLVNLEPGKCYTIIGFAAKNDVKDLDLRLLVPPLYNFLAGEDVTDDNAPVIGKTPNPMCPILPVTIAYKVDISSQKGSGKAGVQLYSKTK